MDSSSSMQQTQTMPTILFSSAFSIDISGSVSDQHNAQIT